MPRGGKREVKEGANRGGRPPGQYLSRNTILTRKKAAGIIESGQSPLDVMMSNMRFWMREVGALEGKIKDGLPDSAVSMLELERKGIVKSYFDARERLQVAAEKAAPYVHPRVATIAPVITPPGDSVDLSKLTDDELDHLIRISDRLAAAHGTPDGSTPAPDSEGS